MAAIDADIDLGSLLRDGRGSGAPTCSLCHSTRVTRIALELEDGSAVDFTNCLDCEHRVWMQGENVLSVDKVLDKTRRDRSAS